VPLLTYGKLVSDKKEKFEDTNGVIRHHKSEDIQYNDRKKKNKHRCKALHRRLNIEKDEPHKNMLDIWNRHCSGYNAFTLFLNLHATDYGHWSGFPHCKLITRLRREGTTIHHSGTRCKLSHGNSYQYLG
jgi:hypothetical protein